MRNKEFYKEVLNLLSTFEEGLKDLITVELADLKVKEKMNKGEINIEDDSVLEQTNTLAILCTDIIFLGATKKILKSLDRLSTEDIARMLKEGCEDKGISLEEFVEGADDKINDFMAYDIAETLGLGELAMATIFSSL